MSPSAAVSSGPAVQRILVRSPNWIGDQVMAYPFFYFLRQTYPYAHIAVVCPEWVASLQYRHLVQEVFVLKRPARSGLVKLKQEELSLMGRWRQARQAEAALLEDLKGHGSWDLSFVLPPSFSAAWLMWRAGVRTRVGYASDLRSFLLTQAIPLKAARYLHRSESYVRLLVGAGGSRRVAALPTALKVQEKAQDFWQAIQPLEDPPSVFSFPVEQAWSQAVPLVPPSEPYWVLAPGAAAVSRRWSWEQFLSLTEKITQRAEQRGVQPPRVVIVGGQAEQKLAALLMQQTHIRWLDLTHQGEVAGFWQVFRQAQFTVCNDSGLAHVAALCGSPVHLIWGAGEPKKTAPLGPGKVQIHFNPVECWPCQKNQCAQMGAQYLGCLQGISAETVFQELTCGALSK